MGNPEKDTPNKKQQFDIIDDEASKDAVDIDDRVWDAYYGKLGPKFMRETQNRIHWICKQVQGKRVLDVGCSQGIVPVLLAREGFSVIGIDSSNKAIEEAGRHLENESDEVRKNVTYIASDFLLKDFATELIDTVVMGEILEHIQQPLRFIEAAAKILPEGKCLVVTVPFGINDFIDHKHTFYFMEPYQLISTYFEIHKFEILGSWLGIVGRRKNNEVYDYLSNSTNFKKSDIDLVESAFYKLERNLRDEIVITKKSLDEANLEHRALTEQSNGLKTAFAQEEKERKNLETQVLKYEAERDDLKARLGKASQIHMNLMEQISKLQNNLERESNNYKNTQKQLSYVRSNLERELSNSRKKQKDLRDLRNNLDKGNARLQSVERQILKTRESVSFRLGYALVESTRSLEGFFRLPGSIWGLFLEGLQNRKERRERARKKAQSFLSNLSLDIWSEKMQPAELYSTASESTEDNDSIRRSSHPPAPLLLKKTVSELKIACIMDDFTYTSFQPECHLLQLSPDTWQAEISDFSPDLLFIESAWRGKDDLWGSKVGHNSIEIKGIIKWCRDLKIPTIFWNKEDPVHFYTFLNTALQFDYIFTTDVDCIGRYKSALGHDRVFLLPFACQPTKHNPIETFERKDAFCFAGAYYVRYPERTRDLEDFVSELPDFRPLDIYDRNFGKDDPKYQFPQEFLSYIIGFLPFDQIDKAYKGYRFAINLNSIKQSQSMFARRVYELLACNTITVSNFSAGLRLMFGDLVVSSDKGSEIVRRLRALTAEEEYERRVRLAALRKVLKEHTYGHRLAYVVSKVSGTIVQPRLPSIAVLAMAKTVEEFSAVLGHFQRQEFKNKNLYVLCDTKNLPTVNMNDPGITVIDFREIGEAGIGEIVDGATFVAGMLAQDYYGPNYLTDMALATKYSSADAIGKATFFDYSSENLVKMNENSTYRPAKELPARCSMIRSDFVARIPLVAWVAGIGMELLQCGDNGLAIDEYNYCRGESVGSVAASVIEAVVDIHGIDTGLPVSDLLLRAERIKPEARQRERENVPMLSGKQIAQGFLTTKAQHVSVSIENDFLHIESDLPDEEHAYLYASDEYPLDHWKGRERLSFFPEVSPGLNLQIVVVFLDMRKQKIHQVMQPVNQNIEAEIPVGAKFFRFGLRVFSSGCTDIRAVYLEHEKLPNLEIINRNSFLLLTNSYPSYDNIYRNAFVHSRVLAYKKSETNVDVFKLCSRNGDAFDEYENITVMSGSQEMMYQTLMTGKYKNILVHFLDERMWQVLKCFIDQTQVTVWVHGSEIQPYSRRAFNYSTEEMRADARAKSERRMTFWRSLLRDMPKNLKLVFVSQHFAEEVMQDLGFRLPEERYTIIHNPIDTDLFRYESKSAEQRKKILSIRPYASATYANDLSVKAILRLSEKSFFRDLAFRLIGDGPLFDETLAPLRRFDNIAIERRFLQHEEIAELHRENGLFLCPTRMDSQGVSRDEAMSSGLVPVTNAVAAVPEFVDDTCGILVAAEDAEGLAKGIEDLFHDEKRFLSMSEAAARRVRNQSSAEKMIAAEIALIRDTVLSKEMPHNL